MTSAESGADVVPRVFESSRGIEALSAANDNKGAWPLLPFPEGWWVNWPVADGDAWQISIGR